MKKIILFFLCFFYVGAAIAQQHYRIKADFTIKEKGVSNKSDFFKGQVYFDRTQKKTIYDISFPAERRLIMADSQLYVYEKEQLIERQTTYSINEFSIFNLCLNGELTDFGLSKTMYKISDIEEEDGLVMVTWSPPKELKQYLGKTILAKRDNLLEAIVFFNPEGNVVRKQFYKEYTTVKGLSMPTELVEITYLYGEEFYKITTFKNIVVDEMANSHIYNFNVAY